MIFLHDPKGGLAKLRDARPRTDSHQISIFVDTPCISCDTVALENGRKRE